MLESTAYGRLGLTEEGFWACTPHFFFTKLRGVVEIERAREEAAWHRMRIQTAALLNVSGKSVRSEVRPEDIVKLSFDDSDEWTPELYNFIKQAFEKTFVNPS